MGLCPRPWIFVGLVASLAALSCRSDVVATSAEEPVAEAELPGPSGAALLLLGVETGKAGPLALLRLQNIGNKAVSYRGCGAEVPRWVRQELVGDAWKDVEAFKCESAPQARSLAPDQGVKFRVLLKPNAPPTRVGIEIVEPATGGTTTLWSETVAPS